MMGFTKKNNKSSKKRGFSFIELSIVIAIIGALASGIIGGQKAVELAALNGARSTTETSPVTSMDGIVLWLDTTSKKSFDASETQNGSKVTNWYDINPKLNDPLNFTRSDPNEKPVYTTKAIGRLPALAFSQSSMITVKTNITSDRIASYTGEITVFAVGKNDGTGALSATFFLFTPTDFERLGIDFSYPTILWNAGICCDGSRVTTNFSSFVNRWTIVTGVRKANTTELRINGITQNIATTPIEPISHSSAGHLNIGGNFNDAERLSGGIAEIIVFNRGLGTSEVKDVESYLSQKWKIKLN